jgi:hypothetical protein
MGERMRTRPVSRREFLALAGASTAAATLSGSVPGILSRPAFAAGPPGLPASIDPGIPVYLGAANPMPPEPVPFDPSRSMLQAIYDADLAHGGSSFWLDRTLARPFLSDADSHLFTRGRALYMATHTPASLGFGGGYAYRERPSGGNQDLYTVTVSSGPTAESTGQRVQHPSHWSSLHTAPGLAIAQRKFITFENVAVTILTVTNTGAEAATTTLTVSSPVAATPSPDASELTGTVTARYALTTVRTRLSGDGLTVSGPNLARTLSLAPGESATVKVLMGAIAGELPGSATDYERFSALAAEDAFLTHLREYNRWWADNGVYVDLPDPNVKKTSYYRWFLNRFNFFDGDIPGNDFQFPVDIEGVLGYNNAIQLTVCMRMQDLKYLRDPLYSYGPWLSSGESSGYGPFTDNPGDTAHWNNTYEQYIGREAWNTYKVHGGQSKILANLARYVEGDVTGQLAKFDTNGNDLIEYAAGFLTGNDADAVALAFFNRAQDRTETAFWYSGAKAAAEMYATLGDHAGARRMSALAAGIRNAILTLLWDESDGGSLAAPTRVAGRFGTALRLDGATQYVSLPGGIVSGLRDFTVAAWVNPVVVNPWARVFDFGTGQAVYMFLTLSNGSVPRFAITTGGGAAEQRVDGTAPVAANRWTHVAVTLSGTTATLYVDGAPAGANTGMTLTPASLGATGNDWIGRSQYSDPLLAAAVDEFQVYDRALSAAEIGALGTGAAQGAGSVASYRFDEASGATAVDSSGRGRDATIVSATGTVAGKVFKQRDVLTGDLVPWKDQQNFSPFTEGVVPNTDRYKAALRFFADRAEFPIMPFYTANQHDKAEATAAGKGGSNNFSNINATLQAQLYSRALRDYPSEHITPQMYRRLLEWLSWTQYIGGDNGFPDNNEFWFNYDPSTHQLGRSFIHHDVLGAYNFIVVEDVAGLRPRLDDVVELWPIDFGYDHFAVNNLSYHGSDVTIVWDRPNDGRKFYAHAPEGYSLYVAGRRVLTLEGLAHVTWDSGSGRATVHDGSRTRVTFEAPARLREATDVDLARNSRVVDMFQRAGVDLTRETGSATNLARGRSVSASFTTTTPPALATAPENAVDGFTVSRLPLQQGSYLIRNPIWGTSGSPNAQDWYEIDLGAERRVNVIKLYFYSNKRFGTRGGTYREPAAYTVQHLVGAEWVDAARQVRTPATPLPNYNRVEFRPLVARRVRVLMTPTPGFGIGLKEIQVFDTTERNVENA